MSILIEQNELHLNRISDCIEFEGVPSETILITLVSPARNGSSATANVFSENGIPVGMQIEKSIMREILDGQEPEVRFLPKGEVIMDKETLGPDRSLVYDPFLIFEQSGFSRENIRPILLLRDPQEGYASQKRLFGQDKVNLADYAFQVKKTLDLFEEYGGIPLYYNHFADVDADKVFSKMFNIIGISDINPVLNFNENFMNAENNKFYDDPPEKFISEINARGRFKYKPGDIANLSEEELDFLTMLESSQRFQEFKLASQNLLFNND